ncbi:hypothetical protein Tco_0344859 [Tanacetum coccineum]
MEDKKKDCHGTKPQPDQAEPIEDINLNVVTRSNGHKRYFSTLTTILSIFDRGKIKLCVSTDEQDEFRNPQHKWNVISWKLHSSSGVHSLMTEEGLVIHMLIEKKYPLKEGKVEVAHVKAKIESEEVIQWL